MGGLKHVFFTSLCILIVWWRAFYYPLLKQLFFAVCFLLVFDPESNYKRSRGKHVGIRRLGIGALVLYSDAAYYASGKKQFVYDAKIIRSQIHPYHFCIKNAGYYERMSGTPLNIQGWH